MDQRPTKEHILREIRRLAEANGGNAVGIERFEAETGIRNWHWSGKFWARWSDAVREAGYEPNAWNTQSLTDDDLLRVLALAARDLGKFPTRGELGLRRQTHPEVPSHQVFVKRIGNHAAQVAKLLAFADANPEFEDVAGICAPLKPRVARSSTPASDAATELALTGVVYMIRMGEFYKIGRSNDLDRRTRELRTQLPVREELVHTIETDDPSGIEAYWHQRFRSRRANGEWFQLHPSDVAAFRRRSYM